MFRRAVFSSLLALGTLGGVPAFADAQTTTQDLELVPVDNTAVRFSPIPGLFNRALYDSTGRFYDFTSIPGQLNVLFGWRTFLQGSFFDIMVSRDAKLTETLYYEIMEAQQAGPPVRTADIPNPFDTSLLENPSYLSPGGF